MLVELSTCVDVAHFIAGGAAERAGLHSGDKIIKVNLHFIYSFIVK